MRSSASILIVGAAFAAAAPQQLDVYASELPSLVSELGPIITQQASALIPLLESLQIPGVPSTAVVSDLPSILQANLPALETYALGAIPSGIFSPAEMSAISAASPAIFSEVAGDIDSVIAELPQTLPVTALGPYIASQLPALESALLAEASSLIPVASSILTALDGEATGTGAASTGFPASTAASGFSGALTPTASAPVQTFTGAANANGWGKELVGAAAVVGVVGALL